MKRVAVIILNYMNYKETITCVNSVFLQKYKEYQIVVVDNGSQNESYQILKKYYTNNDLVQVLRVRKNYGFAKGNNIGIKYARERFGAEFMLLINSDTELLDENYINVILSKYKKEIGVIGSEIILRNGKKQRPYWEFVYFQATLLYYFKIINQVYVMSETENFIDNKLKKYKKELLLHGSAFMLTPAYFEYYDGLYSRTFLYTEEILLYIMCRRVGLGLAYMNETSIIHKEDQSSKYLYMNNSVEKMKHMMHSYKYVVWESFMDYIRKK